MSDRKDGDDLELDWSGRTPRGAGMPEKVPTVPVHRDPELASALAQLALGDEVPQQMWDAVAQVLAWAYGLGSGGPTPNR